MKKMSQTLLRFVGLDNFYETLRVSPNEQLAIANSFPNSSTADDTLNNEKEDTMKPKKSNSPASKAKMNELNKPPHKPPQKVNEKLDQDDINTIQSYLTSFRKIYDDHLKPNIGLQMLAVPYDKGVIIQVGYKMHGSNNENIVDEQPTIDAAFNKLKLNVRDVLTEEEMKIYSNALQSNGLVFSGTSFLGTDENLYIVKDYYEDEWTEKSAKKDVHNILVASYN